MPFGDEEAELARSRRTLYLLVGGAVSLALPLIGLLVMRALEDGPSRSSSIGLIFSRREAGSNEPDRINPAAAPARSAANPPPWGAPTAAPVPPGTYLPDQNSSLSFIRRPEELAAEPAPQAPPPPPTAPPPAPEPAKPLAAAKANPPAPKGPKPFAMPRLRSSSGFQNFRGGQLAGPQAQQQQPGMPDVSEAVKAASGAGATPQPKPGSGADLPRLGQLKMGQSATMQHAAEQANPGGAPPDPAKVMGSMPDLQKMMQGQQPPAGAPNVSDMLKSIPGLDGKKPN